ncbi:metal ABC transporter substrate-binding protein [Bacillus sp. FJAT-50079]|uniref:metal ABC transporter substrate-binding protein n=1 Tax=Bacillus sp. FJAT-50079 TaxID=2833577 RepID=UPI001BCA33F3|nr:metal ABC transporter substrate-binding protein [Bacillus sp. FJAT-50079]MBS4209201.1 metal ABC transporter substrate-binding protein [Bacillus sp. FJAT-50079]
MRRLIYGFMMLALSAVLLYGCNSTKGSSANENDDRLKVVTTYSVIYDIVKNVGGEAVAVESLAPIGSDPHQYEPLPADVQKTTDADVVFYNGLNLETGGGWFNKLLETTGKSGENAPVFKISEGVTPMYLKSEGNEGEEDPHAWLDVSNGIKYAENVKEALIKIDPEHKELYEENAEKYIEQLETLHADITKKMEEIPKEKRILVSSEGAFKYFADAYGFEAFYIWEINSHDEGTPDQLKVIVDTIRERNVQALFVESSVDPRSMETVSKETGVPIVGKIFTDSLGKSGSDGDTYMKMVQWNADMIYKGLKES